MNANISGSFSPEKGFFRAVDDKSGGGGPAGGGGKDDENNDNKKDQEPQTSLFAQLKENLQKIDELFKIYEFDKASKLLEESLKLTQDYQSFIPQEQQSTLRMYINAIKQKAEQYDSDFFETEKEQTAEQKTLTEESTHLLSSFDSEIKNLEAQSFVFADNRDWVDEAFKPIKEYFSKLKEFTSVSEAILKEKETKMLQLEYKKRREAMFNTLSDMERAEDLTEGFFAKALEGPGLSRMNNIVVRLEQLDAEKSKKYVEDLKKVDKHYKSRKWLLITWLYVSPKVFEGSGTEGERSSFGQVGDNQFPIKGPDFQELILGGLDFDQEFGGTLNQRLGVKSVSVEKFGKQLDEGEDFREEKEVGVTLFTFCMREFDRIYKNGSEGTGYITPDGKPLSQEEVQNLRKNKGVLQVNTQNLRENKSALVKYVSEMAKKYLEENRQNSDQPVPEIDEHAVDLAFRTHLLLTMHHCRYAEGSPSLKDDWYYAFNWPSYVLGYRKKGVDKFDWRATILQFGIREGFEGERVTDDNILAKMFDASKVRDVKRKLEKRGMLDEGVRGLRSLRGLINGYSILLEDVSPEVIGDASVTDIKPDYSFLAPPLRYLFQKDKKGEFVTFSTNQGAEGDPVFLDEVIDKNGDILYELLNYKGIGSDLMEYYNCMNQHGINSFLNQFVKAERFEFIENATSPKVLKNWKNEARYAAPLLPRVGRFARMRMKDFGDPVKMNPGRYPTEESRMNATKSGIDEAIMDRILYQIIFINCILRTSYTIEKKYFWSDVDLKSYLLNLSSEKILSTEESKAIFDAVVTYRGQIKMFIKDLTDGTVDQVAKRNIFK